MCPERTGDMDPRSNLNIYRDASGDIVVEVYEYRGDKLVSTASVEFCTILPGGGQSPKTFDALLALIEAIKHDNQKGRLASLPTILEEPRPSTNWPSEPE